MGIKTVREKPEVPLNKKETLPFQTLTHEEEKDLGKIIQQKDHQSRTETLEQLVRSRIPLVIHIAKRFSRNKKGVSMNELVNVGILALFDAAKSWKGRAVFGIYAEPRIRGEMIKTLQQERKPVRIPPYRFVHRKRIRRAEQALDQELGRAATPPEVQSRSNLNKAELDDALRTTQKSISLDEHARSEDEKDDTSIGELLRADSFPDQELLQAEFTKELYRFLNKLSPLERIVLTEYYGFEGGEQLTEKQIGKKHGLSQSRISEIKLKALKKLKRFGSHILKDYLDL